MATCGIAELGSERVDRDAADRDGIRPAGSLGEPAEDVQLVVAA